MPTTKYFIATLVGGIAFICFCLSVPEFMSYWDSSEFISTSYKLQTSHPPGASFYTLFSAVFSGVVPTLKVALLNNCISAFFGAIGVFLLFLITWEVAQKIYPQKNHLVYHFCAAISGLSLAFSYTFWTAATETEVYTFSFSLFLALIYIGLRWYWSTNKPQSIRLLLLFVFLYGISATVHLVNFAVIIPLSILVAYKLNKGSFKSIIIYLCLSVISFFLIQSIFIKGFIKLGYLTDFLFVNSFNFPVNSGIILLFALLISSLVIGIYSTRKKTAILHYTLVGALLFYVGLSSLAIVMIRSKASTAISNIPSTSQGLLSYINASQFGVDKIPLIYGPNFNAPLQSEIPLKDTSPYYVYDKNQKKYVQISDGKLEQLNYDKRYYTLFPRMFHRNSVNTRGYNNWAKITGKTVAPENEGNTKTPTFMENVRFFFNYQVYWLNLRYLLWNFSGKQNHYKANGSIKYGNWLSGFSAIDNKLVGPKTNIPLEFKKNTVVYYMLPLLLGIIGLFSLWKHKELFFTSILLFLIMGIGITVFVNPTPLSLVIRERDYIFLGSFIIFCFWIGLSCLTIFKLFQPKKHSTIALISIFTIVFIASPLQLFAKGLKHHRKDESKFIRQFAKLYLDSCPKNAVLFTNGDNTTFPLLYLQEVEKYRTDVKVVNFNMLNLGWYVQHLKQKVNEADPITFSTTEKLHLQKQEYQLPINEELKVPVKLPAVFDFLNAKETGLNVGSKKIKYIPSRSFAIPIDSLGFSRYFPRDIASYHEHLYKPEIVWTYGKEKYTKSDIIALDIITTNINKRPICFTSIYDERHFLGLKKYLVKRGTVNQLAPYLKKRTKGNIQIVDLINSTKLFFDTTYFEGIDLDALSPISKKYIQSVLRRNHYFTAQALEQIDRSQFAKKLLDDSQKMFPNDKVPYLQFAFNYGKLYKKMNLRPEATAVANTVAANFKTELDWLISFNPPNKIINTKYTERKSKMYAQILTQTRKINHERARELQKEYDEAFLPTYKNWKDKNLPQ